MDILCFSHLQWNFVYQRPQHLLSRFTNLCRVFYIEEPEFHAEQDGYALTKTSEGVWVVVLRLTGDASDLTNVDRQKDILSRLLKRERISEYLLWYYTPLALLVSDHLQPQLTVYDCMDELAAFKFAPPVLKIMEQQLLARADIVFTGGHSLYEAKKPSHDNIHAFPSSIDRAHFARARGNLADPADQANIPHTRFGFYGVIDERFDIGLIEQVARACLDWHFVLVGPVVKIDPATLPRLPNIHYLGAKTYQELPAYLHGWDIAMIPFLLNEHTRFISPTKTPEYLAGGKPVISSAIRDVVNPYGIQNLVHIANDAETFIAKAKLELGARDRRFWLAKTDAFLEHMSWDNTWQQMVDLIDQSLPFAFFTPEVIEAEGERSYV